MALALQENPEALILCNGYKDRGFIETALLAQKLGRKVIITVDRMNEVDTIINASRELGIKPRDRGAGAAVHQGRGQVGGVHRRPLQVRPHHHRDGGDGGEAAPGGDAGLAPAAALPHRVADHRHPRHQGRAARGQPHLRGAARAGREHALHGLRRRPGRGLRRQPDQLPLLGELHLAGVRGRHRQPGRRGLQRQGRAPPGHRHRVGPRPDRAPFRAGLQRPRTPTRCCWARSRSRWPTTSTG